jgi:hypothetical protein
VFLTVGGEEVELPRAWVTLSRCQEPVTAADVRRWIRAFVDLGTVEQLIVYFAGHGVNLWLGEYWLLSGAPDDPNEAVNMRASADLARYCGIPHVVFISRRLSRTDADSIQAHGASREASRLSEPRAHRPAGGRVGPVLGEHGGGGPRSRCATRTTRPRAFPGDLHRGAGTTPCAGAHADPRRARRHGGPRAPPSTARLPACRGAATAARELGVGGDRLADARRRGGVRYPPECLAEVETAVAHARGARAAAASRPWRRRPCAGSDATDGSAAHDSDGDGTGGVPGRARGRTGRGAPQRRVRSRSAAAPAVVESRDETLLP